MRRLAGFLLVVLIAMAATWGWSVVEDGSAASGLACVLGLMAPAIGFCVLYLVRAARSFLDVHDEGVVLVDLGVVARLRWEEIERIRRESHGGRATSWWLETRDGRRGFVAFDYPDEARAAIASRLARRGVRPQH